MARKRYKPEEIIAKLRQAGAQWWCLCNRLSALGKDVAFDPGRASAPRIAVPHMLPSSE
jgi:hypothetical protein